VVPPLGPTAVTPGKLTELSSQAPKARAVASIRVPATTVTALERLPHWKGYRLREVATAEGSDDPGVSCLPGERRERACERGFVEESHTATVVP